MTKNSDLLLCIERYFDSSRNWNLYRCYDASLGQRVEGFTERWGDADPPSSPESIAECWKKEQESVESICATEHPSVFLRIFQYRPAWLEQLALRIAGLPHVVVNSNYAVTESTGPLPLLQDFQANPPAMTGRNHPTKQKMGCNSILEYLKMNRNFDLDESLSSEQFSQALVYKTLIQETLHPALIVLRYQDEAAWEQINRPRGLAASSRDSSRILARLQVRSEKRYQQSNLSPSQRSLSTEEAIRVAKSAYQVLEHALSKSINQKTSGCLMGTTAPTLVDAMLWDHLMDALTDVHLVIALADFPCLVQFAQSIWDKYFITTTPEKDWQLWNAEQNETNAFSHVPSLVNDLSTRDDVETRDFRHAVHLMEHLSVRDRNLRESLVVAKEARARQKEAARRPFETWHRWRLGGSLFPSQPGGDRPDVGGKQEEKIRQEYKRNDETWMASVAIGTTVAVLLFGLKGQQQ